jgi:GNAT superfamily N-acetyltransferase
MKVTSPATAEEFDKYYDLRWQALRAPWGQPRGSERDEHEAGAEHAVIWGDDRRPLAVGRLHFNTPTEAQIRYMAVAKHAQRRGLGRAVVEHLEQAARERGATEIVLNARKEVAPFYARLGYEAVGAGPTILGSIEHVRMRKSLF